MDAHRQEHQKLIEDDDDELFQDSAGETIWSYEDAINHIGFGWFHVILTVICGWANASDSIEVLCVSLVLPSLQCDMGASSSDLGMLTAVVFMGSLVGGYSWGSLGDVMGRKWIMVSALFMNGLFGFLSSFAPSFWLFFAFRFLSGVGVGGSVPVIWSYYSEFQPSHLRGRMLSCIATFWMIGSLITAGLAWVLVPRVDLHFWVLGSDFQSWRIFLSISTFSCFSASLLCTLLPESPKFLLENGKKDRALEILAVMYQRNTGSPKETCPIKRIEGSEVRSEFPRRRNQNNCRANLRAIAKQTVELFHRPIARLSIVMIIINFTLSFGGYGLTLWLPELFARSRASGVSGQVCQQQHHHSMNGSVRPAFNCSEPPDSSVFRDTFLVSLASLPGNAFTVMFMDRLGRKPIFFVGAMLSALSAFMVWFVSSSTQVLVMSCVFGGVTVLCWNCLDAFSTELFPTHLRSTAMGVCLMAARLGAILGSFAFGALIDAHCAIPILMVAAVLFVCALLSLKLPETTNQPLT